MTSVQHLAKKAFLIRRVEQKLLELFAQGKLFGTVHTCIGQELVGVTIAEAIEEGDWVFSNHRCHGHLIAKTDEVEGLIGEIMGRETGLCAGWGGSQHLCSDHFFSNGVQGGIVPVATGLGFGEKLRNSTNISVVFIGEGTLGEGVVYESANIASKLNIPLLIILENNKYSQSTSQDETIAGSLEERFSALGFPTFRGDTWNLETLLSAAQQAVESVRNGKQPAFLGVETYRLMAHSKGDDDRDPKKIKEQWEKDWLERFEKEHPSEARDMILQADKRIARAVDAATKAPFASMEGQSLNQSVSLKEFCYTADDTENAPLSERMGEAIGACFRKNMEKDERIIMLGEDICDPYGGAFKVTRGLSESFPERVINMPISEAAIVGVGNGLALNGFIPVCEIMFGDFLTLAFDQLLNHASKFQGMYQDKVRVPLIVRTPMGGRRGYGPTHSQSIEKYFLGMPQTRVLALHHRITPSRIYDELFKSIDQMTLVIENKMLYTRRLSAPVPEGYMLEHSDEQFPTTRLRPEATPDITIACYGGMLPFVETASIQAFDECEIVVEIISPTQLYPLNPTPILNSVQQSKRLLIVEEGVGFAAWGAEVVTQLMEQSSSASFSVKRCVSPEIPLPTCKLLENQILPNETSIFDAIEEMMQDA